MRPWTILLAATLTSGSVAAHAGEVIERVLAVVDQRVITLSDVRMAQRLGLMPAGQEVAGLGAARDHLIDRVLVLDEVDRFAPAEPDAPAIEAGVAAVRRRFGSDAAFQAALGALGVELSAVRQWVRNDLRLQSYLDQRFAGTTEPSREEIENQLRQHPELFTRNGDPLARDETEAIARERAAGVRREALIREWIDGLRSRADVSLNPLELPPPGAQ